MSLQHRAASSAGPSSAPPVVQAVLRSPGQALDSGARTFFEPRFGHDFSRVRAHSDANAAQSAQAVGALAYTVGRDLVFGNDQYSPGTSAGRALLAHELVHVVQHGRVPDPHSFPIEIGETGSPLEREADAAAERIAGGLPPMQTSRSDSRAQLRRACPRPPTGLGATSSLEACAQGGPELIAGKNLLFCQDSTELTAGQSRWLKSLIDDAVKATQVELHGNASTEGPGGEYNFNLACKRASAIATQFRAAGVTAPIKLFTHGPTGAYGGEESNRNVVVLFALPPEAKSAKPADKPGKAALPNADYGPSPEDCAPYLGAEVEDYLGTYYQQNANAACLGTPDDEHNNCVRHCLQSKLSAFVGELKSEKRPKASEVQLPPDEGVGRCRSIWEHHVQCYKDCGCQNSFVEFKHFFPMCDQPFGPDFIAWSIRRWNPCMGPRVTPSKMLPPFTEP